jgi:hypothetical protein
MSLTGGKRKVNKGLKAWVTFVKKVQKEETLSYKDAIHRAKVRKDKGEKWMTGGDNTPVELEETVGEVMTPSGNTEVVEENEEMMMGGKKRRRTMRRSRGRTARKGRTARRGRGRASRRH